MTPLDPALTEPLRVNRIGFGDVTGLTFNQAATGDGIESVYSPTQTGAFGTLLANLFHPDRWLLWLGVAFILCVYFFPAGIVGRLRLLTTTSPQTPQETGP